MKQQQYIAYMADADQVEADIRLINSVLFHPSIRRTLGAGIPGAAVGQWLRVCVPYTNRGMNEEDVEFERVASRTIEARMEEGERYRLSDTALASFEDDTFESVLCSDSDIDEEIERLNQENFELGTISQLQCEYTERRSLRQLRSW